MPFRDSASLPLLVVASLLGGPFATTALGGQEPTRWNVETPTGPTKDVAFDVSEGTMMSLAVSPDGRSILFDLLGHVYEIPSSGGAARRLTQGKSWNLFPTYSPDGKWIAFSSDRSGSHNIWLMDRQGGSLQQVTTSPGNVYRAVWSSDGRRIFVGGGDGDASHLTAVEIVGGVQTLTVRPGAVNADAVEADGRGVIFERTQGAVYPFEFNPYVVPEGGSTVERFDRRTGEVSTVVRRVGGAFSPTLSADGTRLAYLNRHIDDVRLIVRNLATREERTLLTGLDFDRQGSGSAYGVYPVMAWHPNGQRVYVNTGGHIVSVDADSGLSTQVPFTVHVERQMSETIRFPTREAEGRAKTRAHRWGIRTPQGIVFEALGDLWLQDAAGARKNLTQSPANETSPAFDPKTGTLYYASWTDDSLGAVYRMANLKDGAREKLTSIPAQYGSVTVVADGRIAYVRGTGGVERGAWLSNETDFELVVRGTDGKEQRVTGISSQPLVYADIAGKIPPSVVFSNDGSSVYFTEFVHDTLMLERVGVDGSNKVTLIKFPHAVASVPSPDLRWVAVREYQRSFITPLAYFGQPTVVSPYDGAGTSTRIDAEDGGYLTWSADGAAVSWTRATGFYEKSVEQILAERNNAVPAHVTSAAAWNAPRVPGSTAQRTETAIEYPVDAPDGIVALTGARVVTMNGRREVIDGATIIVRGARIAAIGPNVAVPPAAKVFDVTGTTIIPGIVDVHAHPHIEQSALHVIEQQPTYLSGPLAYGVTTIVEIYGNEYRDSWLSDMTRAGKIDGPRFLTTGSAIFGERHAFRARMFRPIETLEDALEQLRWNKDYGAIAVKDYGQTTRKRRQLTITAARILGLNVVSESAAEPQMNLTQLMDGVTGIEHTMGISPIHEDMIKHWGATKAGNTPTLLVVYNSAMGEGWYHQASKLWEDPKLTTFIAPEQLMRIRSSTHLWPEDMQAWKMGAQEKKLFTNGTSIQLGAHGQMFGLDAHWELELLTKGGFTPAEALEIATIRGAAYQGLDADVGSIETGKLADLVVLDANPLDDINNAGRIRWVMKNGVLYSGKDAAREWPGPRPARKPYFAGRQ